ncbi:MAG: hypothetical protein ACO3BD_00560 [Chitinophagaceae bacterium]
MKQFILIISGMLLIGHVAYSQKANHAWPPLRWEASAGSGLFADMFYTLKGIDPPSYPGIPGENINLGKIDRLEFKYHLRPRSAISAYVQHGIYRDLLGVGNDRFGYFTEYKRTTRRWHFTFNYNHVVPSGKIGSWTFASGFQVQIEKDNFPFYRVDDDINPTYITEMGAMPYYAYFEDWAIPLTIAHHWHINKNLRLGILMNTAYTMAIGWENLALMGQISIPFGKQLPEIKIKRKNKQP